MRTISIDIEIDGDDEAAMEAIDAALDAGLIQEAIHNACDDDNIEAFDIESATCNYRDAHVVAFLREQAKSLRYKNAADVLDLADAIERGEHHEP